MSAGENKAVFLSYASQDADAARHICDTLRAAGVEVWFDQNELIGGDAWDAKIRKQIAECALFVPIISAATQARLEGYFRIEWKLAAQRTHAMAEAKPFLLPVVIDATRDTEAHVPTEFKAVQWTRLPGGGGQALDDATEKFCARVGALLDRAGAALAFEPGGAEDAGQKARVTREGNRRVPAAAWLTLGVVALVFLVWWAQRRYESGTLANAAAAVHRATVQSAAVTLTPAQKLVVKARQILDGDDELKREKYFLAEDLVKRAVEMDPAEPTAWAFYAQMSQLMVYHAIDRSDARVEAMRSQAERARALGPDTVEAQLASANVRIDLRQGLPELEAELLALVERNPNDWRIRRSLGLLYRYMGRPAEAVSSLRRAREVSGGSPIADAELVNVLLRTRQYEEAEKILSESLAKRSSGRLLTFDQLIRTQWRGDLASARAALEGWPDWWLAEDRGAIFAWRTWFWSKNYNKAIAAAQRIRRDYINDTFFIGPRAVLTARAHEAAGHVEAARTDWRTVQQLTDRELAAAPTDLNASFWKAWALARLGDSAGAQAICAQMQQRNQLGDNKDDRGIVSRFDAPYFGGLGTAPLWATVGRNDLALAELRSPQGLNDRFVITRAMLELDPAFDPLRQEPEFLQIVAKAAAPKAESKPPEATNEVAEKSIAVLAFANLSDDKANEYFSDGISEELLNALGKVPGLKVSGRTSSFSFKGKNLPAAEIARQLNVNHLVDGSVRKEGATVRISAQLINAADGFQMWSETFRREAKSVLALQEEIAGLIAQQLSLKLGTPYSAAATGVNPEAFELYLQGRQAWSLRTTAGFERAEDCFDRALALDPNFARAWAGLADLWTVRGGQEGTLSQFDQRNSPQIQKIVGLARRAIDRDPSLAEAHAALGNVLWNAWNFADAARELQVAVKLNPNYASAYQWLGRVLISDGRMDESLHALRRAHEVDPLAHKIADNLGLALVAAQRHAEALTLVERALTLQSDSPWALALRVQCLAEMGRAENAIRAVRPPLDSAPPSLPAAISYGLARAGARAEAEQMIRNVPPIDRNAIAAAALLLLGSREECFRALESGSRTALAVETLLFWPVFDEIRHEPRFSRMLAELGMTEAHARAQAWRAAHPPEKAPAKK